MSAVDPQDQSLGELFGRVTSDLTTLVREEMQLAKTEIKAEVKDAGKAGGLLSGGALAGYLTLLFASVAIALGLATFLADWLAFAIVAVVYAIAAAVLLTKGRDEAQKINPVPEQTVETLKEDVQWAKNRNR